MFHIYTVAYIDSSSSYMIQIIAGVMILIGILLAIFWKKLSLFVRNKKYELLEKRLEREELKNEQVVSEEEIHNDIKK